ncbi:MAG: ABC transporter permease [Hominimerdicola sp.]
MDDLVLKFLKANKKINILQAAIILLAVSLSISILILNNTVSNRITDLFGTISKGCAVTVEKSDGFESDFVEEVRSIEGVSAVYPSLSYSANAEIKNGIRNFKMAGVYADELENGVIRIIEGSTISDVMHDVLISQKVASKENLSVGDKFDVVFNNETYNMKIAGIYQKDMFQMQAYYEAYVDIRILQQSGVIDKEINKLNISLNDTEYIEVQKIIDYLYEKDNTLEFGSVYAQKAAAERDYNSFSMLLWAIFSILAMIIIYLVYNFTIIKTNSNMTSITAMRMIGARNKFVESVIIKENMIVGLISSVIGAIFALPVTFLFIWVYSNGDMYDMMPYFEYNLLFIPVGLIVGLVVPYISTFVCMRKLYNYSLINALRNSDSYNKKEENLKRSVISFVFGLVIMAFDIFISRKFVYVESEVTIYALMVISGLILVVSIFLITPLIKSLLCTLLLKLMKDSKGSSFFMALKYTKEDSNNASKIVSFFTISVMIASALMGMFSSTEKSLDNYTSAAYNHDYFITFDEPTYENCEEISRKIVDINAASSASWTAVYNYSYSEKTTRVFGVDLNDYDNYSKVKINSDKEIQFRDLEKDECVVSRQLLIENGIGLNDSIEVIADDKTLKLKIVGFIDSFVNDGRLIIADRNELLSLVGDDFSVIMLVNMANGISNEEFETKIKENITYANVEFTWVPAFKQNWVDGIFNGTEIFYFLFFVITLFVIFAVISNYIASIRNRKRDISVIFALGANNKVIRSGFIAEIFIIMLLSIITGFLGAICMLQIFVNSFSAIFNTDLKMFFPFSVAFGVFILLAFIFILVDVIVIRNVMKSDKGRYLKERVF